MSGLDAASKTWKNERGTVLTSLVWRTGEMKYLDGIPITAACPCFDSVSTALLEVYRMLPTQLVLGDLVQFLISQRGGWKWAGPGGVMWRKVARSSTHPLAVELTQQWRPRC
jgi:hypothetical protein